ncbi:hypothetical protein F8568_005790 [Actinomadura sp. LD22]|uniref:Dienelactone hydrolase domain-containing protein n=1 Tax=Actinomadura physcomitrii TaxID=2650748 RepID=A0A6I4M4C6_9ACTN|nr:dienelactone hydrolase family protein [Actinomadura physcomitrii]MVZ99899.1 hypothetical protein [Actinomadura physcomitrii]
MPVPGAMAEDAVRGQAVAIPAKGASIGGYLARPRTGRGPGLLVLHEAFGLNEHIRDLARRFAGAGFVALAPDLYSRSGAADPADLAAVMAQMFALPDAQVIEDLDAAAVYLREHADAGPGVGAVGFCSGGRQALLHACSGSATLDAVVDCWGGFVLRATPDDEVTPERPVPVIDLVPSVRCPVLAVGGTDDVNPSPEDLMLLHARLRQHGKPGRVRIFEGAGHAFLADYRPTYREQPAHALWAEMLSFLRESLER